MVRIGRSPGQSMGRTSTRTRMCFPGWWFMRVVVHAGVKHAALVTVFYTVGDDLLVLFHAVGDLAAPAVSRAIVDVPVAVIQVARDRSAQQGAGHGHCRLAAASPELVADHAADDGADDGRGVGVVVPVVRSLIVTLLPATLLGDRDPYRLVDGGDADHPRSVLEGTAVPVFVVVVVPVRAGSGTAGQGDAQGKGADLDQLVHGVSPVSMTIFPTVGEKSGRGLLN